MNVNSFKREYNMNIDINKVKQVLSNLREAHPYEEPAIDIIPLIDESYFI